MGFLYLLALVLLITLLHELGHYVAARWAGVQVTRFSLGFGPRLLSVRRGDTEWCLSAIPLGGYVSVATRALADKPSTPGEVPIDRARVIDTRSAAARFCIYAAGCAVNLLTAWVIYILFLVAPSSPLLFTPAPALGERVEIASRLTANRIGSTASNIATALIPGVTAAEAAQPAGATVRAEVRSAEPISSTRSRELAAWGALLQIASLSVLVALLNLLPLPLLDGGHILLLGWETATRRKLSSNARAYAALAGFVGIIYVMVRLSTAWP